MEVISLETDEAQDDNERGGLTQRQGIGEMTYKDKEYWNRVRKSRDHYEEEHVVLDGKGGETEFDGEILKTISRKDVLDVGCGVGLFTLEIAKRARKVVGVDFSEEALTRAETNKAAQRHPKNVLFKRAEAGNLPFSDTEFDVVVSRRGPVTDTPKTLSEAHRVLREDGLLMEITIGERDKENLARIFGRGQKYGIKEAVSVSKRRMLEQAGFRDIMIVDYLATEIFETMKDLIIRLKSAPIIPDFDPEKDKRFLAMVERTCATPRGIETPIHRVTIVARR